MAKIPVQNPIMALMEEGMIEEEQRPYIGMSGLGHPCQRKVWYDFRWAYVPRFLPRVKRIFERGDIEEERVVRDLKEKGITVECAQKEIKDETGHIRGHIDGLVCNVPGSEKTKHLLEVKSMKNSKFNEYIKKGLKRAFPGYYVQINQYMGHLGLSRCLYVVTNKDTEERSFLRYQIDTENFKTYKRIGFDVLTSEGPPQKIGEATWLECKFCDAKEICHKGAPIARNCRTCIHVSIEMNGEFSCNITKQRLPETTQREGCEFYALDGVYDDR